MKKYGERKANNFLDRFGLVVHAELIGNDPPHWLEQDALIGDHYKVWIMDKSENRKPLTFDFWTSYKEKNKRPTNYDILAAVSADVDAPTTANEVRKEMGTSKKACMEIARFSRKIHAFFTNNELDELEKIS